MMRKARPERIRCTFRDESARSIPLEVPTQRHWVAGLVFAAFFLVFALVAAGTIAHIRFQEARDVFGLMMMLFEIFWAIAWLAGALVLGVLTVLFLFYRETARLQGGKLLHVPRLGPIKIVCEYDLAKIVNLRLDEAKDRQSVRIRFDYGNGRGTIGDMMPREAAVEVMEKIRRAIPMSASLVVESPRRAGTGSQAGYRERKAALAPSNEDASAASRPVPPLVSATTIALIAANLLPLVGVLFFGWDLAHVMVLYWGESAIIGVYTALKLCVVGRIAALFAVPFFVGHFGGFMAAHFVFVYGIFVRGFQSGPADWGAPEAIVAVFQPLWPALFALAVSHGISFAVNFIRGGEHAGETIQALMIAPYRRIIVMHITIIVGGALVMVLETPSPALVLLVLLKTAVDSLFHRREHTSRKG